MVPGSALPDRFGKYHVLARLAEGGMAEIFKVKTVGIAGFEKVQVLKRIHPAYARDPRFIRSFVDEARIAAALNHRNIVQIFEFGKIDDELFMAMELIEGQSLRTALDTVGRAQVTSPPMSVALACYVLGEVATGLDYAHRKADPYGRPLGIVHCDIAPSNIVLSHEGYVKILDFGVGRASFAAADPFRLRGKPRYMAPEQARCEVPTAAADVFALGIVAWELLVGLPLFERPDVPAILHAIQNADVPLAAKLNPAVPGYLSQAIAKALSRAAHERGTAQDLGATFARAHRELDPGLGSRSLGRWLAGLQRSVPQGSGQLDLSDPMHDSVDVTTPGKRVGRSAIPVDTPCPPPPDSSESVVAVLGPGPVLGEKRHIVAAACLLEGGTPDDLVEARRIAADIAYKRGAMVPPHENQGPELLAVFGLEVAGEDDVARAMRFALDVKEALRDTPVQARIGVKPAIVRRRAGRSPDSYLLLEGAFKDARTLAEQALPSRTLLGGSPGRLAGVHFAFRDVPPGTKVRQRTRRFRVLELLGVPELRPPTHLQGPFQGRLLELDNLQRAYEAACQDRQQVVCALVGEAGIGKSRLCSEFVARIAHDGPVLLQIAATPGDTPYRLVADLVAAGLGFPIARGEAGRQRTLEHVRRILAERGAAPAEAEETLATIGLVLELSSGATPTGNTENLRDRVVMALKTLRDLGDPARVRLTVIEDWHWADGASTEALRTVLDMDERPSANPQVPTAGLPQGDAELVVITCRAEDSAEAPALPENAHVISIGELGPDERMELIRAKLGDLATREASVALVARRAGGNPFFIDELTSALHDLGENELPENVRGVIVARVDRLPPGAKAALQYAAVIGPVVRARLLEALLGRNVYRALRQLERAGILARAFPVPEDRDSPAEDGDLAFRHGLIQEVVYDALGGVDRRDAHRRIGNLLAERFDAGRPEAPAKVARHLELGGEEPRAAGFYLRAGRLALAAFDAQEAASAFSKALALGIGNDPERAREALAGREQALFHLGDHEAQKRDLDALAKLSADDPRRLADVLGRAAARHLRLGEYAAAVATSEAAERTAEAGGDERTRGEALRVRAEAFERQGELDRALDAVSRALEIFRRIGAANEETRALIGIGRVHLMGSRLDAALSHYGPALERARNSGDAWLERILCNNIAVIHLTRSEFAAAMQKALRSLEICRRLGDRPREGDNTSIIGSIYLEVGCYDEAARWLEHGHKLHEQTHSRWSQADSLVYLGRREVLVGNLEKAFQKLGECLALARGIGAPSLQANAHNELALALIKRHQNDDDLARAEKECQRGVELGRLSSFRSAVVQGLSRAALARLAAGDPEGALPFSLEAVDLLDQIRFIQGPEEEILHTHYRVLRALADPAAPGALARAYASIMAKLAAIDDPEWRRAFADGIELNRIIREEHSALATR